MRSSPYFDIASVFLKGFNLKLVKIDVKILLGGCITNMYRTSNDLSQKTL